MSATTSGALKAHLESKGRGIPWFRDRAPKDQPLPFGVVQEGISVVPVASGDFSDQDAERLVVEEAQATVYEVWRDASGASGEAYTLPDLIYRDLQGALLPTHPKQVSGVKVTGRIRQPQVDSPNGSAVRADTADGANVVATIFTLSIRRTV